MEEPYANDDPIDTSKLVNIKDLMKRTGAETIKVNDFSDPLSAKKPHLSQTEVRANRKY